MTFHAKLFAAAATAALAVGAPAAMAQSSPAADLDVSNLMELDDDNTQVTYENMNVDQLEDLDVYADSGEKVGEVEGVLGNADGEVVAFSVDIEEGFSSLFNEEEVVVSADHLTYDQQQQRFSTSLTEADLEGLPRWDD